MKYYYINLEKDNTRRIKIEKEFTKANITATRINGIYGKNVSLYKNNIFKPTHGIIGCFLSHVKTWKKFLKTKEEYAVIFEDDISFINPETFDKNVSKLLKVTPTDFDILYLGCFEDTSILTKFAYYTIHPTRKKEMVNKYIYKPRLSLGLYGYVLSRKGAEKLNSLFSFIYTHIDVQINVEISKGNVICYTSYKKLVVQNMHMESNNMKLSYPYNVNRILTRFKDSNGIPLSYKLCVPISSINNKYNICGWSILFILSGTLSHMYLSRKICENMYGIMLLLLTIDAISSQGDPLIFFSGVVNILLFLTPQQIIKMII